MAALLLMIATFFLYRVADKLESLTNALHKLELDMTKEYVTKDEFTREVGLIRGRLHDMLNTISGMMAQEHLNRRKEPRD